MAELVVGPATEVVKCFVEPIKRQFNYLCCFNTNIQSLKDEAKRLDDAKEGLQRQVEAAKRNTDDIVPEVESWLGSVDKIQEDYSSGIEPAVLNVKSGCLAIKSRFSLSRKATKMATAMKELHDDGKFAQISIPAPPAAMSSIPFGQVYELKSRKDFEDDIMATLREKKVRLMGLYGMGGVGKTTMAKKIMTRARAEGLFVEIVIAVVSQPVDKSRVQKELAELLDFDLKFDSLLARAQRLRDRLMNSKSILIILDDLWEGLDLEELGIPKECTILLTSRDRDVFRTMNVDKTFQVETLDKEEAWCLFKEKVGACADDQIAQEIVRQCQGLPIAIVTVGGALKDKMNISIWKDALHDLSNPQDIPDLLALVYNPLKLSYDLLPSEPAKSIFLLCCLFSEDYNIPIPDLFLYAWGLGVFEGKGNLEAARNKMQTLVEMLKSRSLLLDGHNERSVKMHDVVRDVGIFIAAKEGLMWARKENNNTIDCSWISLFGADIITLPEGSVIPNLRFLLIEGSSNNQDKLCDNLFERSRNLSVLSIKDHNGMRSLPHTIQLQQNMRTLILDNCYYLEDISIVSELVSLEILRCHHCDKVKELPVEIGRLNQLKLLDISYCRDLSRIPAGVISKLISLEELTLMYSFKKWELAAEEGKNAAVCELNFLSRLTTLKIEIEDASLAAVQIHLPNLVEFDIKLGEGTTYGSYRRQMRLELKRDVIVGEWIHQLLRSTECLFLKGEEGSSKLLPFLPHTIQLQKNMRTLILHKCSSLEDISVVGELVSLEILRFHRCLELKELPVEIGRLKQLKLLDISYCPNLSRIPAGVISKLIMLEELILINSFNKWELDVAEGKNATLCELNFLSRLTTLRIHIHNASLAAVQIHLPNLVEFDITLGAGTAYTSYRRRMVLELKRDVIVGDWIHQLLRSTECLFLKGEEGSSNVKFERTTTTVLPFLESLRLKYNDDNEVGFVKLEVLKVKNCDNIKSLFSPSIAENLVNLRKLIIENCCEMVKLIEDKDNNEIERSPLINLEKLKLKNLPKLKNFCDWECALRFPSLIQVKISKCPLMERFPLFSDSFKDLESIKIKSCLILEQVILWNEEEGGNDINRRITFPKLDELTLVDLPRLTSFCKGIQSIEFPLVTDMEIKNCPNMKSLVTTVENETTCPGANNGDNSLHLFCKSKVAFGMLKVLIIEGYYKISSEKSLSLWCDQIPFSFFSRLEILVVTNCGNIKSLFSPTIAVNLVNLEWLGIRGCGEMVKVIEGDEDKNSLFIKLKELYLVELPKLEVFCDWRCALQFPSLKNVYISECPEMERFSFGSLTTPNLKYIWKNSERISEYTEDLNDTLFGGDFLHLEILFGTDDQ